MDNSGLGQFAWRSAYNTDPVNTFKSFQDECDFIASFDGHLIRCGKYENPMMCCKENCVWHNIKDE